MTQTGTIMGTPNYMSPEQIQGNAVDGRSDQFSLAVIAYEMLTGEKPYTADTLPTLLFKIVKEPLPSPRRLNPTLSEDVDAVLNRAFAKAPEDRHTSCTEFASALAIAVNSNPEWQPQRPGSVSAMDTVVSSSQSEPSPPTLDESAEEEATVVAIPPPEAPPPELPQSMAERREEREMAAEKESSVVRTVLLLAAVALIVAAGIWGVRYFSEEGQP
ncbi:MAG: protein kinase, partial [bacterium]|nr:protein kinase [bacterium]